MPLSYTVYKAPQMDLRHSSLGYYVDIANCFELPVGPFDSGQQARTWVEQNRERLTELYGKAEAA